MKPTEILHREFANYHQHTKRHITNRDKALISFNRGWGRKSYKDRFYLRPIDAKYNPETKQYDPAPDTAWEIVLYRTPILTVYPDQTATIDLGNWYTSVSFDHLEHALDVVGVRRGTIHYDRPNKWTPGRHLIDGELLFDGLRVHCETGEWLNPQPLTKCVVDYDDPAVKDIRRKFTEIKRRYTPIAQMHTLSLQSNQNPFEDAEGDVLTYEQLCAETTAVASTYVGLVGRPWRRWSGGYWSYNQVAVLALVLQNRKDQEYRKYLKEI